MTKISLQTPTARAKLAPRSRPYLESLQRGLHLGYRALDGGFGTWIAVIADKGQHRHVKLATADNIRHIDGMRIPADGVTVLTHAQAVAKVQEAAAAYAGADVSKPKTIAEALDAYALDLKNRNKRASNAQMPRFHLTRELLDMPVDAEALRTALREWRQGLIDAGMNSATINRVMKPLAAALNLAAKDDPKRAGANREAWRHGLEMLGGGNTSRNDVLGDLSDAMVKQIVAAAYEIDQAFGLFVQVHAETGLRSSQIARLTIGDLRGDRLMVPASRKGGDKRGDARRIPIPVRITPTLAAALVTAATGRSSGDVLLRKADGMPWRECDHRRPFMRAAKTAGAPEATTMYALRHSSIVRHLKAGRPTIFVAKAHDTSVAEIEGHYASHIAHYTDLEPLLDTTPGANVVPLLGVKAT